MMIVPKKEEKRTLDSLPKIIAPGRGKSTIVIDCAICIHTSKNIELNLPEQVSKIHTYKRNIIFLEVNYKKYFYPSSHNLKIRFPSQQEEYNQQFIFKNMNSVLRNIMKKEWNYIPIKHYLEVLMGINIQAYIDLCQLTSTHPDHLQDFFFDMTTRDYTGDILSNEDICFILNNVVAQESCLKIRQLTDSLFKLLNITYTKIDENYIIPEQPTYRAYIRRTLSETKGECSSIYF